MRSEKNLNLTKQEYLELKNIYPELQKVFSNRLCVVGSVAHNITFNGSKLPTYKKYNTLLHDIDFVVLPASYVKDSDPNVDVEALSKIMNITYFKDTKKAGEYTPDETSRFYISGYSKGEFNLPINIFMFRTPFDKNNVRKEVFDGVEYSFVSEGLELVIFYFALINRIFNGFRIAFEDGYHFVENYLNSKPEKLKIAQTYWEKYGKFNASQMIKHHESWQSKISDPTDISFNEFREQIKSIYLQGEFDWMEDYGVVSCIDTAHIKEIDIEKRCNILDETNPKYVTNFSKEILTSPEGIINILEKRKKI